MENFATSHIENVPTAIYSKTSASLDSAAQVHAPTHAEPTGKSVGWELRNIFTRDGSYMCIYIYICAYMCTYMHTYTYTYIHIIAATARTHKRARTGKRAHTLQGDSREKRAHTLHRAHTLSTRESLTCAEAWPERRIARCDSALLC